MAAEKARADLGTLRVEQHRAVAIRTRLHSLTQVRQAPKVQLMVAVRKVEPRDVHARVQQFACATATVRQHSQ